MMNQNVHTFQVFRENIFRQCCRMYGFSFSTDNATVFSRLKCLIAVSGGSDSIGLLALCAMLKKEFPSVQLGVGYVNHGMQTHALQLQEEQVVNVACEKLDVPMWGMKLTESITHATAQTPHSEHVLRKLRYRALIALARTHHCNCIATAHHRDDEFETIIMRLFQGRASLGIQGIPDMRTLDTDLFLIRPCMPHDAALTIAPSRYLTAEALRDIALSHGLSYHTDPHNDTLMQCTSKEYLRSKIRSELIPHIKKIFPNVVEKTIAMNKETQALIKEVSHDHWDSVWMMDTAGMHDIPRLSMPLTTFARLPRSTKKHMLFYAMNTLGISNVTEAFLMPLLDLTIPLSGNMLKHFYIKHITIVVSHSHLTMYTTPSIHPENLSAAPLQELPLSIESVYRNNMSTCILASVHAMYYNRITVDFHVHPYPSHISFHATSHHGLEYYFIADAPIFIDWISKHDTIQQHGMSLNIRSVLQHALYKHHWSEIPIIRTKQHILVVMGEVLNAPMLFKDDTEITLQEGSLYTARETCVYKLCIHYGHIALTQYK